MALDNTRYDFRLDADGDLYFSTGGDVELTPSDSQHVEDAIISGPAWNKQYPDRGVNIGVYRNGSFDRQTLEKIIRLELTADGYTAAPTAKYSPDGELVINANATR